MLYSIHHTRTVHYYYSLDMISLSQLDKSFVLFYSKQIKMIAF